MMPCKLAGCMYPPPRGRGARFCDVHGAERLPTRERRHVAEVHALRAMYPACPRCDALPPSERVSDTPERRLEDVWDVLDTLREVYTPKGCGVWLYASQSRWGDKSAVELLKAGRGQEVVQAIHQLADGAFA